MVLKPVMSATYGHRKPPSPREVLTEAAAQLTKYFDRIDPPLGEVIRIRQGKANLFVRHGLKPVHFTRAEVAAHAVTRTVVRN